MATAAERETVIQFDDASDFAVIYTHHERWRNRLDRLGALRLDDNGHGGATYHVPRSWIGLPRKPRKASGRPFLRQKPPVVAPSP